MQNTYTIKELCSPEVLKELETYKYKRATKSENITWDRSSISSYELSFVKVGDVILNIHASGGPLNKHATFPVLSPVDGICLLVIPAVPEQYKLDVVLRFCSNLDDFGNFIIAKRFRYHIVEDDFDSSKLIKWEEGALPCNGISITRTRYMHMFGIEANTTGVSFKFIWNREWRKPKDMGIGDVLTILFEDKEKITFTSKTKPIKIDTTGEELQYSFSIDNSQLHKFASTRISAWKMDFTNGDAPFVAGVSLCSIYNAAIFCAWIRKNIELFAECGYEPKDEEQENSRIDEACYVYLMHDEANGFYKIGISNHPKYREHTLQSEKPTIVLVIAKKFPIRPIAEAFEAALHKTYEAKRIRGEWFKLNLEDVANLKIALA